MVAAVCAIVANQRPVSEEQQVGVRVEERAASIAAEAIDVPSVTSCVLSVYAGLSVDVYPVPSTGVDGGQAYQARKLFLPPGSMDIVSKSPAPRDDSRYLSAPLARIYDIVLVAVLVEQRLRVATGRVHGGRAR